MQRFNIYNFTGGYRPILEGVFYDGGYKVASDAIVLAAIKADYPETLEHHIVTKGGRELIGKYPHWRSCVPDGEDYHPYDIDTKKYEAFVKERRGSCGKRWQEAWSVKVGPAYFKARNFDRILAGMKEIGATKLLVRDHRRTAYAKTDKGIVMIFPIFVDRAEDDPDTLTLD